MLVNFNKKYITVFAMNFSYRQVGNNALLNEPQDLGQRPKSRTSASYENALWTKGISWISASSKKPLVSGEREFKRPRACVVAGGGQFKRKTWTFFIADVLSCVCYFWRAVSLTVCWLGEILKCASGATTRNSTAFQLCFTKMLNKQTRGDFVTSQNISQQTLRYNFR